MSAAVVAGATRAPWRRPGSASSVSELSAAADDRAREVHNLPGVCVYSLLMAHRLPLFFDLAGRRVLLVGAGPVAAAKLGQLLAAGADVRVVAPEVCEEIERAGVP